MVARPLALLLVLCAGPVAARSAADELTAPTASAPASPNPDAPATKPAPKAPRREDPGVKEDLAKLQGTFAHEVRSREGKVLGRVVKHVQGNKEMVIHEQADGTVTHAHMADFEITRAHGVRLFRFYNPEIIEGPRKGEKVGPGMYVYRVDDEAFTEAVSFVVGQEKQAPAVRVYKRVKDLPTEAQPEKDKQRP